ncbi:MAG: 4-(cytidine 5'-diphospho)-2-C-methyl-D-erythritol kinase [Ignavibacteria bacterium]|jgi:4-diphosphocytidyl-2-C-methyl-D-erythritol kinase|nr:4-(cytidine 5'-diphospho)-2-C-methyl-D-erythritol kinase [Ignavibacteria bacterium]
MFTSEINSYAKINFGLRILEKRDDGFHNLETIFYPVRLHDKIKIKIQRSDVSSNSVILRSNKSYIPLSKDNLCYKAVEMFFREFRISDYYKIEIELDKFIPVGGGLGGGSSNASVILKFLLKYFKTDIAANKKRILDLALKLGSDVPFFLIQKPSYATGRGEIITVLKGFINLYDIIIVNPNLHISTKWAFEKLNFKKGILKVPELNSIKTLDIESFPMLKNDFEDIVFVKYPELKNIKDELRKFGAVFSSMSGTGATMYGLFEKNKKGTLLKCRDYYKAKKYFTYYSV